MTRDGEIATLREHLATIARLADRLRTVRSRIGPLMPITPDRLAALDADSDLHVLAFLKTFEQLEDTIGRMLKVIAMVMQFGRPERLTPRDVVQRAVALGVLEEGKAWSDAVRVRNELAHEYPLQPIRQSEQVNKAWDACATLFATIDAIERFIEVERLLHGDL